MYSKRCVFKKQKAPRSTSEKHRSTSKLHNARRISSFPKPNTIHRVYPRRSFLYVPGSNLKMLQKSPQLGSDTICYDIEDGVAYTAKSTARLNIRAHLRSKPQFLSNQEICIRINSLASGLFDDDIHWLKTIHDEVITSSHLTDDKILPNINNITNDTIIKATFSQRLFHTIAIPKIDTIDELKYILSSIKDLDQHIKNSIKSSSPSSSPSSSSRLQIIGMVETPLSLINLQSMLEYNAKTDNYITGLIFGGDDYVNSAQCIRTDINTELDFPRNYFLMHAKAYNLQALDIVCKEFKDTVRFNHESQQSSILGFTGRQLIHPSQIVHYSPQQDNINWALGVMCDYHENTAKGIGAWTYKGMMIDMPTIRLANNILKRSLACNLITKEQADDFIIEEIDAVEKKKKMI